MYLHQSFTDCVFNNQIKLIYQKPTKCNHFPEQIKGKISSKAPIHDKSSSKSKMSDKQTPKNE